MQDLRSLGPAGVNAFVSRHGTAASPELDRLCGQIHAHTTLLYWFTDLDAALAEAARTRRPVLSLRLLGRLDEELSCANSRFFRRLLYPEPRINELLRDAFVLHWQSVRPVPKVTVDFGDGRRLERTLTGNSLHLVLDARGRAVDAIPGLFAPDVFLRLLRRAHGMASGRRDAIAIAHEQARRSPPPSRDIDTPHRFAMLRDPAKPDLAMAASRLAPTKHAVELPLLRAVATPDLAAETAQNLELHARVHELFASGATWPPEQLVAWVYRELFLMPPDDPALGLDVPEPFTAEMSSRT